MTFALAMKWSLFFSCFFLLGLSAQAQAPKEKEQRILLVVDASSSMLQPWKEDTSRYRIASDMIGTLLDSMYEINMDAEFGLRVYGHQYPAQANNCYDTKREIIFTKDNRTQMGLRLDNIRPQGVSPIAYSLKEAAKYELTSPERYDYCLILVSDGGESCGGDLCKIVEQIRARHATFNAYILGLTDMQDMREQYSCLGKFMPVTSHQQIDSAIKTIVENYRRHIVVRPDIEVKKRKTTELISYTKPPEITKPAEVVVVPVAENKTTESTTVDVPKTNSRIAVSEAKKGDIKRLASTSKISEKPVSIAAINRLKTVAVPEADIRTPEPEVARDTVRQPTPVAKIAEKPVEALKIETKPKRLEGTFLTFTTSLDVRTIDLFLLTPDAEPRKIKIINEFKLPMKNKVESRTGRYRVIYNIWNGSAMEKRIKEFYVRENLDNIVDLD
jgi:hypothetical protein